MKKLLIVLLTVSIGFNLYLIDVEYVVQDDLSQPDSLDRVEVIDQVKLAQSAIKNKKNQNNCKCKEDSLTDKVSFKSKEDFVENQAQDRLAYDEKEISEKLNQKHKEWLEKSERFFEDELRLTHDQIMRYQELSVARQIEVDEYFNPKMEALRDGDQYQAYMHTTDDTIFMGKLAEKYNKLLEETFGRSGYMAFREFVSKHNQSAIKEDKFFYTVEF